MKNNVQFINQFVVCTTEKDEYVIGLMFSDGSIEYTQPMNGTVLVEVIEWLQSEEGYTSLNAN